MKKKTSKKREPIEFFVGISQSGKYHFTMRGQDILPRGYCYVADLRFSADDFSDLAVRMSSDAVFNPGTEGEIAMIFIESAMAHWQRMQEAA